MKDRIGELLLRAGLIDEEQLEKSLDFQRSEGCKPVEAVLKLNYLTEEELVEFLAREKGVPTVSLNEIDVDPDATEPIVGMVTSRKMRS